MSDILLEVRDLHASVEGKEILKGLNLTVREGEVHAIMGPNGSGKSTMSGVLAGNPAYTVTEGSAKLHGVELLDLPPETRSHEGLFLSFQYPVEIPGVSMVNFMRAAVNAKRKYLNEDPMSASDFLKLMRQKREIVELDINWPHARSTRVSRAARRSATRYSRWLCSSRVCRFSTRPIRASTSTLCEWWPAVSTSSRLPETLP